MRRPETSRSWLAAILLGSLLIFPLPLLAGGQRSLSVETIWGDELSGPLFSSARWAPDGERLVFQIDDREKSRELWVVDLAKGKKQVLLGSEMLERLAG